MFQIHVFHTTYVFVIFVSRVKETLWYIFENASKTIETEIAKYVKAKMWW